MVMASTKFGVYHGKDKAFGQRFAAGGLAKKLEDLDKMRADPVMQALEAQADQDAGAGAPTPEFGTRIVSKSQGRRDAGKPWAETGE